jgi:hypothetical protein
MLIQQTVERLHELRLRGMADALQEQLTSSSVQELGFEDRLTLLVERELTCRDDRRLQRRLQEARLRLDAAVEDVNFRAARGLDRSVLMRLATAEWVKAHQVVLIVGPTRGLSTREIAAQLERSQRSIQRILKEPPVRDGDDAAERRRRGVGRPAVAERVSVRLRELIGEDPEERAATADRRRVRRAHAAGAARALLSRRQGAAARRRRGQGRLGDGPTLNQAIPLVSIRTRPGCVRFMSSSP